MGNEELRYVRETFLAAASLAHLTDLNADGALERVHLKRYLLVASGSARADGHGRVADILDAVSFNLK